ncbi:MAG: tetratricopeptide repeat protein [Lachnospirales bacterium]
MEDKGIRLKASNPNLESKIHRKIDRSKDTVYWYIKFNIPLDPNSVNGGSMYVTDIGGYVMETFIEYSEKSNLISISPIDTYEQKVYYILNITTSVRSAKGNRLPRKVYILFRLENDAISEYELLKKDVVVPVPQKRPKNYNINNVRSKIYGLNKDLNHASDVQLKTVPFRVNIILGLIGLAILILSIVSKNLNLIITGIIISVGGIAHIIWQIIKKEKRAAIYYNLAMLNYNKDNYLQANKYFNKAFEMDPYNELYEYATNKIKYYLD